MPTTKTRINISVTKRMRDALKALAKREQELAATAAVRLLENALELQKDRILSVIANRRLKDKGRYISDNDAPWK